MHRTVPVVFYAQAFSSFSLPASPPLCRIFASFIVSMVSLFIDGHTLAAGQGLVVDAGFDDGATDDKMIISIPSNTHAPIARLIEFVDEFPCHSGKVYAGRDLDAFLIVYLDRVINDSVMEAVGAFHAAFPEALPFRPINSIETMRGWSGSAIRMSQTHQHLRCCGLLWKGGHFKASG